jgi:hypothetical protein
LLRENGGEATPKALSSIKVMKKLSKAIKITF